MFHVLYISIFFFAVSCGEDTKKKTTDSTNTQVEPAYVAPAYDPIEQASVIPSQVDPLQAQVDPFEQYDNQTNQNAGLLGNSNFLNGEIINTIKTNVQSGNGLFGLGGLGIFGQK